MLVKANKFQQFKLNDKMLIKMIKSNKDKMLRHQLSGHKMLNPLKENIPANASKPPS